MLRHWPILAVMTMGCGRVGFDDVPVESGATLDLDFTSIQLGTVTVVRSSAASYFDANGVLRRAGPGEPRFDHDPMTRAPRGLLIEQSRTNLIVQSASPRRGIPTAACWWMPPSGCFRGCHPRHRQRSGSDSERMSRGSSTVTSSG